MDVRRQIFALIVITVAASTAQASDYTVTNSASFYNAVQAIDSAPSASDRIIIANSFTMGQQVLAITTTGSLTVVGNGNTINGGGAYRPFFIESGNVTLQDLTITGAQAHGGNGSGGGGGGMGAGAAIFVDTNGHVSVQNVNFTSDATIGGDGGNNSASGGGGGGLGGNGAGTQGGGGGLYGAGGTGGLYNAGGGGGGELGNGGLPLGSTNSGGGGGGGSTLNGGNATASTGGTGGGSEGGAGGDGPGGTGQNAPAAGGGGGGGGEGTGSGGDGALFGGGGGSEGGTGGKGGDFGGGGGAYRGGNAGNGGFGGGGGGAFNFSGGDGGNGGFGAGAGGTFGGSTGTAGFGGGSASTSGTGGGGAAFGGAIFIRQGGTITFVDATSFSGNTITAGSGGGSSATSGSTSGNDIFLMRGTTSTFNIGSSQTLTFNPVIGNNDGTGNSGVIIDKQGTGTLVLTANSTLSGTTIVEAGTLQLAGSLGGAITVNSGSTLSGTSATLNQTITSSGHVLLTESGASSYNIGSVSGAGDFTKAGAGTLSLTGTATYSGGTIVAGGTVIGTTDSLQGTITNSGNVTFNQSATGTYSSGMSGSGGVRLAGTGMVIFTHANYYTGGTTVDGGTLAGTTDSLHGTITDSANVTFNQSADGTFAGSISGSGSVTITGSGNVFFSGTNSYTGGTTLNGSTLTLLSAGTYSGVNGAGALAINTPGTITLDGNNSYTGGTTVDGGTLVVNGTVSSSVAVNSGGVLMGVGTVGDTTVNAGGTIFPGIVGAPLTINGSFVQTTGSTYTAEVSPTASDKIIVNGHASIQNGATFNIALDAGTYSAGTRYVVLTASGGISGTYSTSILPSPGNGLFFALDYEANEIDLLIQSIYSGTHFAAEAQTYNQLQVATALDTISPTATGSMATYITQLEGLSPTQARQAFDQLAGDIYPSIAAIELQTTTAWLQLISNRLASQMPAPLVSDGYYTRRVPRAAAASSNDTPIMTVAYNQPVTGSGDMQQLMTFRRLRPLRWTGWMQGYGLGGAAGSNGNASALSYGLGGTVFGIDRWVGPKTLVGLMGGYANANVGDTLVGGNTSINGYQVGVYGAHRFERWYLQGVTAYSGDNYTTNRQITFPTTPLTAHSSYAGNQFAKYVETGLNLGYGPTVIQPLMGVQYIYLDQQRFNETGAGALNLAVGHQTTNSVRGMLGLRMASEFTHNGRRWMPIAQARWQREWADGTHLVTSSFAGAPTVAFNTAGNTLGRDFGLFTLGSNLMLSQRTSLYGGYDLQTAARYTAHLGSASLQYRW